MNEEEARKLDVEVEMAVFGSQWFQVRVLHPSDFKKPFEWLRLLTTAQVSHYPLDGWLLQAISDDKGMALFLAENMTPLRPSTLWDGPHYSTDIAAASYMEEEIQRRGLVAEYGMELMARVVTPETETGQKPFTFAFDTAHASPKLRCQAALAAVRAKKDTQ